MRRLIASTLAALDRPAWSALTTRHAALSEGGDLARRYQPTIVPFAAARDDSFAALEALAALAPSAGPPGHDPDPSRAQNPHAVPPGPSMILLQADPVRLPPGLVATMTAEGVQMLLRRPPPKISDARIEPLTEADAPEMLALAELTKPGPFTLRAQALGEFWGIKENGRLVAMAGERMQQEGFAEVSGIAVHPDFQGRGLGRLLTLVTTHHVLERGDTPYLHAFASNTAAIRLYEALGYELRTMMNVAVLAREGDPAGPPPH